MKLLVFGVTGTAGSGVLDACIESPQVTEVRTLSRREPFVKSPKLRSSLHGDFRDYSTVADAFAGIHACFWCLGISATQVPDEAAYRVITSDYAKQRPPSYDSRVRAPYFTSSAVKGRPWAPE